MDILILVIAAVFLIWLILIYNKLVAARHGVLAAWSDIDVQLKRRHDLIPKLVTAVQAYASYERSSLEEITRLRTQADIMDNPGEKSLIEQALSSRVRDLVLLAEDYPDLKANQQYLDLLRQLSELENHIQYARRYYNGSVRDLNVRIESFPDLIVARLFMFKPAEYFELDDIISPSIKE